MYKPKIFCIIILSIVCALFYSVKRDKNRMNTLYSRLLIITLVHLWLDIATVYTVHNTDTVPQLLNDIAHRLFYESMLLVFYTIYVYMRALVESELNQKLTDTIFKRISMTAFPVSAALSAVLPIEYISTPKGNYTGGPAAYVLYASVGVYIALFIQLLICYRRIIPPNKIKAIVITLACELSVALYQFIFPTSLVSSLGIVLLIMGLYLTAENPDALLIERLKETTARADAANNAKTVFLANMSHEIRTPINAVLGMNEMILRESREQEILNYASEVKSAARSLLEIINDILDITKIEAGKLELIPVEYSLEALISSICNMISFKAAAKQLEFRVEADDDLPSTLIGDDIRLRQVLVNLLNNAVKYTHTGSVTLEVRRVGEDSLYFCVKDTGIGIKREDIEKLYVPFERIEEKRNRSIEGTGLGMNITLQLLALMESELKVSSVYGEGSEFSFTVKQRIIDDAPIDAKSLCRIKEYTEKEYTPAYQAPDARILVVDDNLMNRKVFINLLKQTRIRIDEAASGAECLRRITEVSYDLIFMDHMMPEMDGIQTFLAMGETEGSLCLDTPVIALTANAVADAKQLYYDTGFDGFLPKPIDPDKLERMVFLMLDESLVTECERETAPVAEKPAVPAELPVIEGIDWSYGMLHFKDKEALLDTVRMFFDSVKRDAEELDSYFGNITEEETRASYRIKVHSMKSSAAMIGIVRLAGMAMELEAAARSGDCGAITALHPVFIARWRSYSELLGVLFPEDESKKNASEYGGELAEIFERIRAAAEDMDVDALDELSAALEEYRFNEEAAERIDEIRGCILNFEIERLTEYDYSAIRI